MAPEPLPVQAHSLAILSEYTHALDTLPMDLSRNFADLRELDAVLSSSMQSITARIAKLTDMVQNNKETKEDRLWLLTEIADDARRLKLGGDDKIRVACQAADNLRVHSHHMRDMSRVMPHLNDAMMSRNTRYPHVGPHNYAPTNTQETGRRRKITAAMSGGVAAAEPSPQKSRKRPVIREEEERGRLPRKEKVQDGRAKNGKRKYVFIPTLVCLRSDFDSRQDRQPSVESQVSITSYPNHASTSRGGHGGKRSRAADSAHDIYYDPRQPQQQHQQAHLTNGSRRGHGPPDLSGVPPPSHHPSLPGQYHNGAPYNGRGIQYDPSPVGNEWEQSGLEGPGMPMARHSSTAHRQAPPPPPPPETHDDADADADVDADVDDTKTYCFCERVSFGQMIGCDNQRCEREWVSSFFQPSTRYLHHIVQFHLECVGLSATVEGTWFCEICKAKNLKAARGRAGRGGKRKGTGRGGRGGAAGA